MCHTKKCQKSGKYYLNGLLHPCLQIEFESMVKAFEDEKAKLSQQKKVIFESRQKLKLKKQKLEEQKQILNKVAKTLAKAEITLEQKIDEIESINQVCNPLFKKKVLINETIVPLYKKKTFHSITQFAI